MEPTFETFACEKCGKPYDWQPEIVGKVAKCPCGAVLKIPSAPPGTEASKKETAYKEPNPGCLLSPPSAEKVDGQSAEDVILPMYAPVANSQPRTRAPMEVPDEDLDPTVEAELKELAGYGDNDAIHKPNPYLDLKLPLILLGIGLMLAFGKASMLSGREHGGLVYSLFHVMLGLTVQIVLMMIGMLAAAKFGGLNFGTVPTAVLKIA